MSGPGAAGWTGGQYSAFRFLLGAYLALHFAWLVPWGAELFSSRGLLPDAAASPLARLFPNVLVLADAPAVVTALLVAGIAAAVALAVGWRDRIAALVAWYVLACLFGRNPLIANPALPFVGWMLLAHALLPPAPYGSLAARGRIDPAGGWRMPRPIFAAAWIVMAVGYSYSGFTKLVSPSWLDGSALERVLENPLARPGAVRELLLALPPALLRLATWGALALELLFAPLALARRARPWIWLAMVGMHAGLLLTIDFADLSLGMLLLHAFTFDPGWIRPAAAADRDTVFYDGHCGLCHGLVRFLVAEDRAERLVFAPLQGDHFSTTVPAGDRAGLPDSIVVGTPGGTLLVRSAAVLHLLRRLGGGYRALAVAGRLVPVRLADLGYDAVASVRRRLSRAPGATCPLLPPALRARFRA